MSLAERVRQAATSGREHLERAQVGRWELYVKASTVRETRLAGGRAVAVTEVEETGVAVRTFRSGRAGFAAASGLGAAAARRAVEGALDVESPVPFDILPPRHLLGTTAVPDNGGSLPAPGWAAHTAAAVGACLAERSAGRLRLEQAVVEEGTYSWLLLTGDGFVATHDDASTVLRLAARSAGEEAILWREWAHVPAPESFAPAECAARVADRALLTAAPVTADPGIRDLILHPEVTAACIDALVPLLLAAPATSDPLPGLLARDGRLAGHAVTLVDVRDAADVPTVSPCDGEGVPSRRVVLLENGIPRHRLASYRDSLICGDPALGGARRLSYRDYPSAGIANLTVDVRDGVAPAELLGEVRRAFYLLRPLSVTCNLSRDEYRLMASGVWIDRGRILGWHPVVELRGGLGLLLRRIEAVGTDLHWHQTRSGCIAAPSMLVRRQPVVG